MPYYDFICCYCSQEETEYVSYAYIEETKIECSCGNIMERKLPSTLRVESATTSDAEERITETIEENRTELETLKEKKIDYEDL
jgi:hypothetical protein